MTATVLQISVPASLYSKWRDWFCPEVQPVGTDVLPPGTSSALPHRQIDPTPEWADTFSMWAGKWTWPNESEFLALSPKHRRSVQAARRKTTRPKVMPAWPTELAAAGDRLLFDWVSSGVVRPSEHRAVSNQVWERAASCLPRAHLLAGSFPTPGSGPNCFGTVMAAAGDAAADETQIPPDRFQAWLDQNTEPASGTTHDNEPGTVFTWTEQGHLAHAMITLGGGWMFGKPSQAWSSPRLVSTVRRVMTSWRFPGARLTRYRIRAHG